MKIIARNTCYIKSITEMKSKGLTFSLLLEHSRLLQIIIQPGIKETGPFAPDWPQNRY